MFGHFVELDLVNHHVAFDEALLHIDNALVRRTAELEFERTLSHDERAVDENIRERQKLKKLRFFGSQFHQTFVSISRKNNEIESAFLNFASKRNERSRLIHRVATAERHAIQQRVFLDHRNNRFALDKMSALKIMSLRILAPRAIVVAALRKNSQANTGTVYKRFRLDSCDFQWRIIGHGKCRLHAVLYAVANFSTFCIVEAVDCTDEVTRDATDTFETDTFTIKRHFFFRHPVLLLVIYRPYLIPLNAGIPGNFLRSSSSFSHEMA